MLRERERFDSLKVPPEVCVKNPGRHDFYAETQ